MKHFLSAFFCVFLLSLQAAESAAQNCAWRFRDDGSAVFSWTTEKRGPLMQIAVTGADGKKTVIREREKRANCVRVHEAVIPASIADGAQVTVMYRNKKDKPLCPPVTLKRPEVVPVQSSLRVELTVRDPLAPRRNWPIISGVPFAPGQFGNPEQLMLTDDSGKRIDAAFEVFSRWPDYSVKWLSVAFNADTVPGKEARYFLVPATGNPVEKAKNPTFETQLETAQALTCEITFADGSTAQAKIGGLKELSRRPLPGGEERIHEGAFSGHPEFFLGVQLRVLADGRTDFDWTVTAIDAEQTSVIRKMEWKGFPRFAGKDFVKRQLYAEPPRIDGFACDGDFTFYSRDFWQQYPKGLVTKGGDLVFEVLPELPKEGYLPKKLTTGQLFCRYFWYRDGNYTFPGHMQIAGEFTVIQGKPSPGLEEKLKKPLFAAASPEYYCGTGAFGLVLPAAPDRFPEADEFFAKSFASHLATREKTAEYGWMSFGDWFGERVFNWGNNEYDVAYTTAMQFARTGNPDYLERSRQMARHFTTVDLFHTRDPGYKRELAHLHIVGHVGEGLRPDDPIIPKGKGQQKWFFSRRFDGHGGHDTMTGSFYAACLTGDKRMFDAAFRACVQQARYMSATVHIGIERTVGWNLVNVTNAYNFTEDPVFLNAAKLLFNEVIKIQTTEGHLGFRFCKCPDGKNHRGGKAFAMGILLHGLRFYYEITGDERAKTAVIRGASWLIDKAFDEKVGKFRYRTGCPKLPGGIVFWTITLEGITYAGKLSGDPRFVKFVVTWLPEVLTPLRPGVSGKSFAMETRLLPHVLCLLEGMGVKTLPPKKKYVDTRYNPVRNKNAVILLATDKIRETGGEIVVHEDRSPLMGTCISHWNKAGHELVWRFTPPRPGRYRIGLAYCCAGDGSRELIVDGKPVATFTCPATGGLGHENRDWRTLFIKSADGKNVELELGEKPAEITLRSDKGDSVNLNYIWLERAD